MTAVNPIAEIDLPFFESVSLALELAGGAKKGFDRSAVD